MTTKPPSTHRVDKLRAGREADGIKRREIYATDAEFKAIKAHLKANRASSAVKTKAQK